MLLITAGRVLVVAKSGMDHLKQKLSLQEIKIDSSQTFGSLLILVLHSQHLRAQFVL